MRETAYPLPANLLVEAEMLMESLPDREDTVFRLRRFMGRVYAEGYQDGRIAAGTEASYDRRATTSPVRPVRDAGDEEGTG